MSENRGFLELMSYVSCKTYINEPLKVCGFKQNNYFLDHNAYRSGLSGAAAHVMPVLLFVEEQLIFNNQTIKWREYIAELAVVFLYSCWCGSEVLNIFSDRAVSFIIQVSES